MRFLHRSVIIGLLALTFPCLVSASGWHRLTSKQLGLTLLYPGTWIATSTNVPGAYRVQLGDRTGKSSFLIQQVPMKPGSTVLETARRFVQYTRSTSGDPAYTSIVWTPGRVAGQAAATGATRPIQTEGGLSLSRGVEVVQRGKRVYEIEFTAYHTPPFTRVSQFPTVYRQILASWKFL